MSIALLSRNKSNKQIKEAREACYTAATVNFICVSRAFRGELHKSLEKLTCLSSKEVIIEGWLVVHSVSNIYTNFLPGVNQRKLTLAI